MPFGGRNLESCQSINYKAAGNFIGEFYLSRAAGLESKLKLATISTLPASVVRALLCGSQK